MKIIKTNTETTSTTTVTATEITFEQEGKQYTAIFTHVSCYDKNTNTATNDLTINNQVELSESGCAYSNEEENILWEAARDIVNEVGQLAKTDTLENTVLGINWPLLRDQKFKMAELIVEGNDLPQDQINAIEGILALIDAISDAAVQDGLFTEEQVFKGTIVDFIHPELQIDWNTLEFEVGKKYASLIIQTNVVPETYELRIEVDEEYTADYLYDSEQEAERDRALFYQLINTPSL